MRRRLLLEWCLIAIAAIALVAGLTVTRATSRLDNVLYDVLIGIRPPPPSDRILLVLIDDASVSAIGRWPWPRSIHARAIDQMAGAGAAAIAYDVLFTEPSPAPEDQELARAIRASGKVTLPVLFEVPGLDGRTIDVRPPVEPLASAAAALGEVTLLPDEDGIPRSMPLFMEAAGREWPHLMEVTYQAANGHPSPVMQSLAGRSGASMRIPFQRGSGAFRTVPFVSVLNGEVPRAFLQDRIVLVGIAAAGLGDRFRVPSHTGGLISGVEVQANLLNSLLSNRFILEPGLPVRLAVAVAPVLLLLVAFWWLVPSRALPVALAMLVAAFVLPTLLLLYAYLWLPPSATLIGLLAVYPLWGWRRLQAVDTAIGQELRTFAAEAPIVPATGLAREPLDPIGGQTARLREAIAEMRNMRRLVSDTIDGVRDPLIVTDLADHVILANKAALQQDSAIVGKPALALLSALAPETGAHGTLPDELTTSAGRSYAPRRLPLRGHDEVLRGWILHFVDISDIRQAQREREQMLEFLSHDMRAPQSTIITLVEQSGSSLGSADLAQRVSALARRTLTLAENFVQLARFSVAPFAPEECNLADVLIEASDEIWPLASRRNVKIAVSAPEEGCYLMGERDPLTRALLNLLSNAVKFSPEGGTVHCALKLAEDAQVECIIEDDGPGMPQERRNALFARFGHRSAADRSRQSVGLGLAFVGAAIERHGGTILCEARQPHGTRFVLRLPALPDPSGHGDGESETREHR